jgi:serine protease AprX
MEQLQNTYIPLESKNTDKIEEGSFPGKTDNVVIEMKGNTYFAMNRGINMAQLMESTFRSLKVDAKFTPVPIKSVVERNGPLMLLSEEPQNYLVKARVSRSEIPQIELQPNVIKVWDDTPIMPFTCPISPCDCDSSIPKGNLNAVAKSLGVDLLWGMGHKGNGVTVAIVDGGITAIGRSVLLGETTKRISNVTDGWPADWGTSARNWEEHGNMCATDVLGMAPDATIYDIRISGTPGAAANIGSVISNALTGFQWCIDRHRENGTPQIMSNSWGIYQSSWDPVYARNPTHFFTRKVLEALDEGIIILFAAGNCGDTCPSGSCGADTGPGKSIWGANGHSRVITVGAVNKNGEFIGYSSQGPAALDPKKPDFCSVSHFEGYFPCDNGTSAATPIAAGVIALFKQGKPSITHDIIKNEIMKTAKDIGPIGWDPHSGAGILQAFKAFNSLP